MLTQVLRLVKGTRLTYAEGDNNFRRAHHQIPEFAADYPYFSSEMCVRNGNVYRATTGNSGTPNLGKAPEANPSDWELYVPTHLHTFSQIVLATKDEDDMVSNSAVHVPTQQSVKAYVDAQIASVGGGSSYTDEQAQDAIALGLTAGSLSATSYLSFTYDDPGNGFQFGLKDNIVPAAKLKATNSPSNGFVPSFDSATGNFTWVAAGAGGSTALYYAEPATAPSVAPTVSSPGSIAIGDGSSIGANTEDSFIVSANSTITQNTGSSYYNAIIGGGTCDIDSGVNSTILGSYSSNILNGGVGGYSLIAASEGSSVTTHAYRSGVLFSSTTDVLGKDATETSRGSAAIGCENTQLRAATRTLLLGSIDTTLGDSVGVSNVENNLVFGCDTSTLATNSIGFSGNLVAVRNTNISGLRDSILVGNQVGAGDSSNSPTRTFMLGANLTNQQFDDVFIHGTGFIAKRARQYAHYDGTSSIKSGLSRNLFSIGTTNATTTQAAILSIADGTIQAVDIRIAARQPTTGDSATFTISCAVKAAGGVASIIGSPDIAAFADTGAAAWTANVSVNSSNLRIDVTGEAAKTIEWSVVAIQVGNLL